MALLVGGEGVERLPAKCQTADMTSHHLLIPRKSSFKPVCFFFFLL